VESPRIIRAERDRDKPIYAVWELTMRCDHACAHCGSRAGKARPRELELDEMIEVADALARLGCREVTLIGGEAYLYPHIFPIMRHLSGLGLRVTMQTGGRGITPRLTKKLCDAGLSALGVSIDGPEDVHDTLRASKGSFQAGLRAIQSVRAAGLPVSVNTQVNRLNAHRLPETLSLLEPTGIRAWRVQLTVPMGRAADHPEWILEPYQIIEVIDTLSAMQLEIAERSRAAGQDPKRMLDIQLGNNVGYYGPHEIILRSRPGRQATYWQGCQAGRYTIGIESDGTVKGCPSLPTAPYAGGNVRELSLEDIWKTSPEIQFVRTRTTDELWGFCKTCDYADVCRAGCSFTTHCTLGRRGNNPFCYHRAATLRREGRRERLQLKERAPGKPYDFGKFEIIEEDCPDGTGDASAGARSSVATP
jgi:radical SAM protein with 4Fe4S-binding SPASM domain